MTSLIKDFQYGIRMMLKAPGFTLVVVLTLALGTGANSAIFSLVNGVLLRPLPYREPEKLIMVWSDTSKRGAGTDQEFSSYPAYLYWRDQNRSFEQMAAFAFGNVNITGDNEPERISGAAVSVNFFKVLGIDPLLGRDFLNEEEKPGNDRVVLLSYNLWQRRFGSDRNLIGKTITLDGTGFTVIGILPHGIQFPAEAELWRPLWAAFSSDKEELSRMMSSDEQIWLRVLGKLKPGVTVQQARADMETVVQKMDREPSQEKKGVSVNLVPLHEQIVGDIRPALLTLLGAVGSVLLIACFNVTSLLLARAATRQKEIAIRTALGATRWRIIRQLLAESILLSLLACALGLLLASSSIDLLILFSPGDIPRLKEINLDGRVLGFTLTISLLTGVLSGIVPALRATGINLSEAIKESGTNSSFGPKRRRQYSLLVISEVAVALVLLIGSSLLINSFLKLQKIDPGFIPQHLLTLRTSLTHPRYSEDSQRAAFYKRLIERIEALPGVESAGAISAVFFSDLANSSDELSIEGRPPLQLSERVQIPFNTVSPGYFHTMGINLIKGRVFTELDIEAAPHIAIISEAMARRYWLDEDPIGKRFKFGMDRDSWRTIVGVVRDVRRFGLDAEIRPEIYFPYPQEPAFFMTFVVRTAGDPVDLVKTVQKEVWAIDKDQPVVNVRSMEQLLAETLSRREFNMLLLGLFSLLALLLSLSGIYAVISYSVAERTHEIGIRLALGAGRGAILKLIISYGMYIALIGVAVGLTVALILTRLISSLLYGISATDPLTFIISSLLLTGAALLACYIPALKATRIDPGVSFRYVNFSKK